MNSVGEGQSFVLFCFSQCKTIQTISVMFPWQKAANSCLLLRVLMATVGPEYFLLV